MTMIGVGRPPYLIKKLPVGNDATGIHHKNFEELVLGRREMHDITIANNNTGFQVDLDVAKFDWAFHMPG